MSEPTIYDVARESGFSIKTVSRVINGEKGVRAETVARVETAIKALDYHPNPAAQRLGAVEDDQLDAVRGYLEQATAKGVVIVLPVDVVAATEFSADADHEVVPVDAIPADRLGLDIGPESGTLFASKITDARTVFWNGPMGVFEMEPYAEGTRAVAQALTDVTSDGGLTVVGGGDSAAAVRKLGFDEKAFGHISTGGGASLEFLEGKTLPGLDVLEDHDESES